jgi:hypothetical protein
MSKIMTILESMGVLDIYMTHPVLLKNKVRIRCAICGQELIVTAEAVYRQRKRGCAKYACKSCAGKRAWTPYLRSAARTYSIKIWKNPDYAGNITGKAIAREVIRESEL